MADKQAPVDLDAMDPLALRALIDQAEAKHREKLEAAKAVMRAEFERQAATLGLSAASVLRQPRQPGEKGKVPVKYRGPDGQEWSGRGKTPQWMQEAEKTGRKREEFRVTA